LTAIGKAIIFIPYPFAADDHQARNARAMAEKGASEMILQKDLTGRGLAGRIEYYASNPDALSGLASRAKELGNPDAAKVIADQCFQLADQAGGKI